MDDIYLGLVIGWACFGLGCLLTACAVWIILSAMKDLYYQKLDVLNRVKSRDEAA